MDSSVNQSITILPELAAAGRVKCVGTQVELVPEHQRNDPTVPEWGLPVLIIMPAELDARPGELVRVQFK